MTKEIQQQKCNTETLAGSFSNKETKTAIEDMFGKIRKN